MMVGPHGGVGDLHIPRSASRRSCHAIVGVDDDDVIDDAVVKALALAPVAEQRWIRRPAGRLIRPIEVDAGNLPAGFELKGWHSFAGQKNGSTVVSAIVPGWSSHALHGTVVEHDCRGAGQKNFSSRKHEPRPG